MFSTKLEKDINDLQTKGALLTTRFENFVRRADNRYNYAECAQKEQFSRIGELELEVAQLKEAVSIRGEQLNYIAQSLEAVLEYFDIDIDRVPEHLTVVERGKNED